MDKPVEQKVQPARKEWPESLGGGKLISTKSTSLIERHKEEIFEINIVSIRNDVSI